MVEDPNTIILKTFEETIQVAATHGAHIPMTGATQAPAQLLAGPDSTRGHVQNLRGDHTSVLDIAAAAGERDYELVQYYRATISRYISQSELCSDEDVFETQARSYPPVIMKPENMMHH